MNFRQFKEKLQKYPLFGSDIADLLSSRPQTLRNQVNRWKKKGLIVALKRGVYTLSDGERAVGLSRNLLANKLYAPSYISLESALSYYKLIPERVEAVTSVSARKTKSFSNQFGSFLYRKISQTLYFGFREETDEFGFKFLVAEPEKALLDYLYLNLGAIPARRDYFRSSLRLQNCGLIDKAKLKKYAKKFAIKKLDSLVEYL